MSNFHEQLEDWENATLSKALKKNSERRENFTTTSNIPIERVYGPADSDYPDKLGLPGQFPFTRGAQPTMYRGRLWTMRQYAGFASAEESNNRYRYLLDKGTNGLSVAFDLPTQMGHDSDHALSAGEVGKVGVAIDSLEDMEILFRDIPLDEVTTSMTINATASILLALYLAVADKQGVPWDKVGGTVQNDVLKEYIARGTYVYPPTASMRVITDIFAFCTEKVPRWNTISISGYHIREAGSTAVQEVAFTLADGIAYVQAAIDVGLNVDDFAGRLSFFFNVHNNFFEEIAKYRAARRLWAKIMKERFGATRERSMMLRFHSQTAGSSLTAQQPINNIVRTAVQALAAVCGGTQSLHTNSYDEAMALPTEAAVTAALRTQQIIAHESGVADSIDPMGGSWFVEQLTDEIEQRAEQYIEQIDKLGGAVAAIERGFQQQEIQQAAYAYQLAQESGDNVLVGVNRFQADEEAPVDLLKIDASVETKQLKKLADLKARRDNDAVRAALALVTETARGDGNLMPVIVDAVKTYATLGEVSDAMREVFGEFDAPVFI
ncbi:MAG TPA: methylmalonyl-CoA mutase [Deltaproteobacteria bacterium]|nr:methylmalonyl-CoA mutase [Candidatus Binatota bacterium]HIL12443.1 methylmalonyl-CoA mutase [Deltaproteobacteria bacterium]